MDDGIWMAVGVCIVDLVCGSFAFIFHLHLQFTFCNLIIVLVHCVEF
jgi:hypothetical protein